jgi:hypothetical protein
MHKNYCFSYLFETVRIRIRVKQSDPHPYHICIKSVWFRDTACEATSRFIGELLTYVLFTFVKGVALAI